MNRVIEKNRFVCCQEVVKKLCLGGFWGEFRWNWQKVSYLLSFVIDHAAMFDFP